MRSAGAELGWHVLTTAAEPMRHVLVRVIVAGSEAPRDVWKYCDEKHLSDPRVGRRVRLCSQGLPLARRCVASEDQSFQAFEPRASGSTRLPRQRQLNYCLSADRRQTRVMRGPAEDTLRLAEGVVMGDLAFGAAGKTSPQISGRF